MIQFAYIILYVKNVEKSIEFYEKAFGFSRKFLASSQKIGIGMLDITAGANFYKPEIIGTPKTTDKLPQDAFGKTFFSRIEESRIVVGQPRQKISLGLNYKLKAFNANLRATNFGQVEI